MRRVAGLLLSLFLLGPVAAEEFSSLEERMSAADFRAAGLDKLSADELARLNDWLRRQASGATAAVLPSATEDRRGFSDGYGKDDAIVSSIEGEFRGWKGKGERFHLANGQVWETTESTLLAVLVQNPSVRIEPGFMDAWYFSIAGYNKRVRVKRVR